MILLRECIREILSEEWYHGRRVTNDRQVHFAEDRPSFFSETKQGAKWYSYERGEGEPTLVAVDLVMRQPAERKDLEEAVKAVNATADDVTLHSTYEGDDNFNDYLYVPAVRRELEKQGFDSYVDLDLLSNSEIRIAVVWHTRQIKIIKQVHFVDY